MGGCSRQEQVDYGVEHSGTREWSKWAAWAEATSRDLMLGTRGQMNERSGSVELAHRRRAPVPR
jgi:hypothetical protein